MNTQQLKDGFDTSLEMLVNAVKLWTRLGKTEHGSEAAKLVDDCEEQLRNQYATAIEGVERIINAANKEPATSGE